jgi:hypothetical protein
MYEARNLLSAQGSELNEPQYFLNFPKVDISTVTTVKSLFKVSLETSEFEH